MGFTLIELLAVIFILGVGLTGVSMLFVAGIVSSSKSRRISMATDTAQKQMERIRSAGFSGSIVDADVFTEADGYTILEEQADKTGRVGFAVPDLPNGQGVIEIRHYDSGSGYYPNLKERHGHRHLDRRQAHGRHHRAPHSGRQHTLRPSARGGQARFSR